jgi:tRNA(adenine34) deaminase
MALDHDRYMQRALELARQSGAEGNRPVGSVIVDPRGDIVGEARNRVFTDNNPLAHAESLAIAEAASRLKKADFSGHTIYSSLEPCPMCCWAILVTNMERLVLGARHADLGRQDVGRYSVETFLELTGKRLELVTNVRSQESVAMRLAWNEERARSHKPQR